MGFFQIVCRSNNILVSGVKEKISNFCHVAPDQVSLCSFSGKSIGIGRMRKD